MKVLKQPFVSKRMFIVTGPTADFIFCPCITFKLHDVNYMSIACDSIFGLWDNFATLHMALASPEPYLHSLVFFFLNISFNFKPSYHCLCGEIMLA